MLKNQKGFTVVEILLVLLILVIVGFGGYYVYHVQHETKVVSASASNKTIINQSKQSLTNNLYVGWKTYCDKQAKICLRYPPTWTIGSFSGIGISSPNDNAVVYESPTLGSCANKTPAQIGINNFYVNSINKVSSIQNLEIIGGYSTNGNLQYHPTYILTNIKYVNEFGARVGSIINFPNPTWTCFDHGVITASITSIPNGSTTYSNSALEAESWFTTTAAKTSLQIIQSTYTD